MAWPAVPAMVSRRDAFDTVVTEVAEELDRYLERRGLVVEYAAMDTPTDLGPDWAPEVPLARTTPATKTAPARIIAFRRPIEARSSGPSTLPDVVRAVLVDELSMLFAIPIEEFGEADE